MKFGKGLLKVVDVCNPEWGQYWINYKYMKKKINDMIEEDQSGSSMKNSSSSGKVINVSTSNSSNRVDISKSQNEKEFFRLVFKELKKVSDFFPKVEAEYRIRWERIWESYVMLKDMRVVPDANTWTRLLMGCVKFYKDILLLEIFAIMNYCGFSKILKKHDKLTGYTTREAFMRNVMSQQNFAHYPRVLELIKCAERLFDAIQHMEHVMPIQAEERLFIEALRGLNYQASRIHAQENNLDIDTTTTTTTKQQRSASADHIPAMHDNISTTTITTANTAALNTTTNTTDMLRTRSLSLNNILSATTNTTNNTTTNNNSNNTYSSANSIVTDINMDEFDAATSLVVHAAIKLNQQSTRFMSMYNLLHTGNDQPNNVPFTSIQADNQRARNLIHSTSSSVATNASGQKRHLDTTQQQHQIPSSQPQQEETTSAHNTDVEECDATTVVVAEDESAIMTLTNAASTISSKDEEEYFQGRKRHKI